MLRRLFRTMAVAGVAVALPLAASADDDQLSVSMLLAGQIDDSGFMEAGYNGLVAIRDELGA